MKRKKNTAKLEEFTVKCDDCSNYTTVTEEEISFSSSSSPCEICGSHGYIEAYVQCIYCKTTKTVKLYVW